MANPIYQQGEELLLNQFGSKYLGVAAHTNVNSNEFIVQEDAIISVLTGGDSSTAANNVDYKVSMDLSDVTLKQGALIVAPQGESFQSMTIDSGTIMAYNSVVGGTKPSAVPLLLDSYPDAAAAYSLRKLRTDYTGPAIEVRKTVNNVTSIQDIGFDANGDLDTASLVDFANGGDIFVTKWYDQSGAGIMGDGVQISESDQPKIAENGFVTLYNSMPVIKFSNSLISFENLINDSTERTIFALFNYSGASEQSVFNNGSVSGYRIQVSLNRQGANTVGLRSFAAGINTTTGNNLTQEQNLMSVIRPDFSTLNSYANNVLGEFDYTSRGGSNINDIGRLGAGFPLNGGFSEYIVYQSNQTSNREAIETNINNYYTIY